MFLTICLQYGTCWIIQKSQKMHFWMIQSAKNEVFGHYLEFGLLDWLDVAYFDNFNDLNTMALISLMLAHSKITKIYFGMILRVKSEAFPNFLYLGLFDRLNIADCERNEFSPTFGWQGSQVKKDDSEVTKMHFWMIQGPKKRLFAIFGILVCWIDLMMHIVMVLNVFQDLATLPGLEGSFKNH